MNEDISLKEKCKNYQEKANYFLDANKPIIVHIDGRSFSHMVKNKFNKPFDDDFIGMMNETAKYVCKEVQGVHIAYVQSDEISLFISKNTPESDVFFSGRLCKMQSIIASLATAKFNQLMTMYRYNKLTENDSPIDAIDSELYEFDCKVWNVDSLNDALAWFLFRNIDCVRNSKQQAAQTYLSHKRLMNLTADEEIDLLAEENGIDWYTDYDDGKKYGRYIIKEEALCNNISYGTTYRRSVWSVKPGFDLTDANNREKLTELCPAFKYNLNNE